MERPLNETASALEHLIEEVRELDRRVRALEGRSAGAVLVPNGSPAEPRLPIPTSVLQPAFALPLSLSAGLIPVMGKAVLGIAGAYLLRAAAESRVLPGPAAAAVSAVYAAMWVVSSVISQPGRELVRVVYAATGAVIFFPMLWETTVRFKVLPPPAAAGLLITFAALGTVLAWFHDLVSVRWLTTAPAAATAMVLIVATGELTPFVITLLATCALVESAAVRRGKWAGVRPFVAIIADIGVWLMIYNASLPRQLEAYRPVGRPTAVGVCFALLGIYVSSVGFRTVGLRRTITFFEAVQMAVAFICVLAGALALTQSGILLGAFCLFSAGVFYWAAFALYSPANFARNHHVYSILGLALFLAGSTFLLSGSAAAALWSGTAVVAMFTSESRAHQTLAVHAAIFLGAGALASGLLDYVRAAMIGGTLPSTVGSVWIVAIAGVFSYALCSGEQSNKWPRLAAASLAAFSVAAFLVTFIVRSATVHSAGGAPSVSVLATVRTLVSCAVAFLAGAGGLRWKRPELVWIGYAGMALVTVKLIAEDFRQSSPAALAISLLGYGAVLMLGPRLTRLGISRSGTCVVGSQGPPCDPTLPSAEAETLPLHDA